METGHNKEVWRRGKGMVGMVFKECVGWLWGGGVEGN